MGVWGAGPHAAPTFGYPWDVLETWLRAQSRWPTLLFKSLHFTTKRSRMAKGYVQVERTTDQDQRSAVLSPRPGALSCVLNWGSHPSLCGESMSVTIESSVSWPEIKQEFLSLQFKRNLHFKLSWPLKYVFDTVKIQSSRKLFIFHFIPDFEPTSWFLSSTNHIYFFYFNLLFIMETAHVSPIGLLFFLSRAPEMVVVLGQSEVLHLTDWIQVLVMPQGPWEVTSQPLLSSRYVDTDPLHWLVNSVCHPPPS